MGLESYLTRIGDLESNGDVNAVLEIARYYMDNEDTYRVYCEIKEVLEQQKGDVISIMLDFINTHMWGSNINQNVHDKLIIDPRFKDLARRIDVANDVVQRVTNLSAWTVREVVEALAMSERLDEVLRLEDPVMVIEPNGVGIKQLSSFLKEGDLLQEFVGDFDLDPQLNSAAFSDVYEPFIDEAYAGRIAKQATLNFIDRESTSYSLDSYEKDGPRAVTLGFLTLVERVMCGGEYSHVDYPVKLADDLGKGKFGVRFMIDGEQSWVFETYDSNDYYLAVESLFVKSVRIPL